MYLLKFAVTLIIIAALFLFTGCQPPASTTDYRPLAAADLALAEVTTPPTTTTPTSSPQPQLQPSPQPPRVQCLIFTCPACPPCHAMRAELEKKLPPVGWQLGETTDCMIRFIREEADTASEAASFQIHTWPTLVLLVDGREQERTTGKVSAIELSRRMVVLQKGLSRSDSQNAGED